MNTVETRIRTTSTHPAVDARLAAAARLAREATMRHTAPEACRAVVDALSAPSLQFEGIALTLDNHEGAPAYQVIAGNWPPAPSVETSALLTVPLLLDDARIGELTVYRMRTEPFAEADAALITAAASHASLGVARAQLIERVASLESGRSGGRRKKAVAAARRPKKTSSRRKRTPKKRTTRKAR